jgi:hypothetical protein
MASKLTQRDLDILDANDFDIVGNKPYEDGRWGSHANRDFVHFQLFDANNNLIQYENLSVDKFILKDNTDNVEFFPGSHVRSLGFETGIFSVKYNFLRKLAGDESSVLVRTVDKASTSGETKIGDIYGNVGNIYITEDGLIYTGTEQNYKDNPDTAEQLRIEDLKYQIDEISPSRTEIRLKAKQINSSYIDDFVDIQTPYNLLETETSINFLGNGFETKILNITPEANGFKFTGQMLGGTISIPEVYKVEEIDVAVKSNINFIQNPSAEELFADGGGNVKFFGTEFGWDESLHENSVRAVNWSEGYRDASGIWAGTSHIGYHAQWVQREGLAGGNCLKFTDQNEIFQSLAEWPEGYPYRSQAVYQSMLSVQSQGAKRNDFINIRMDVKSTVVGKGVEVAASYPYELATEAKPVNPPDGYFNPAAPGPTEDKPVSAPDGYVANTEYEASRIEDKPPMTEINIRSRYGGNPKDGNSPVPIPFDALVGTTTAIWGGEGAWVVTEIRQDPIPGSDGVTNRYFWGPNLVAQSQNGTLSSGGEWVWSANPTIAPYSDGQWIVNPNFANAMTAPNGTTYIPEAVNYHPANLPGNGNAFYPRKTNRGENIGWQTAVNVGTNATTLLFKDDLIWEQKHNSSDSSKLKFYEFHDYFAGIRDVKLDEDTDNERTLYDDIFRFGFIQSVDRVSEGNDEGIKPKWYVIFYNNGERDSNGDLTENSNRYFFTHKTDGVKERQNQLAHFTKNIDGPMNQAILDNEGELETHFKVNSDGNLRYHFHTGDVVYTLVDGDNGGDFEDNGVDNPEPVSENFSGAEGANAIVGDNLGYGRVRYIKGDRVIKAKGNSKDGIDTDTAINDNFFRCGEQLEDSNPITYGVRSPAAENTGVYDSNDNLVDAGTYPLYDNGLGVYLFSQNPLQIGALSTLKLWKWTGSEWIDNVLTPQRYLRKESVKPLLAPTEGGVWQTLEATIEIAGDWQIDQPWLFYIFGSGKGEREQGVVWVDNIYVDFTFTDQSETVDVLKPFEAQIKSISSDGLTVNVNKSFKDVALLVGVDDQNQETNVYDLPVMPDSFNRFSVSYINLNPKDLRTYLKFGNDLFLTTNFKQDLISVSNYPNSVIYKLYESLPENYQKFDECIIVKEMANPLEETINVVDFIPAEEPTLVLKTPDINNAESPVQRRQTGYKSMTGILSSDPAISSELRNEFLSQSLDSVEINTDYSQYSNFVNFSSIERRIRNFKLKLENIESYKISSASYVGVSGSVSDSNIYHHKIEETKNNLDDFERYMYFESSSYVSGSIGVFHDNAWPKTGGSGTSISPYVLAHTTSSTATNWFSKAMTSSSLYDNDNNNKLSTLLPEHIKIDTRNDTYLKFTDMIGQHFDGIWEYINALSDTYDRRDKLDEGMSKDLLYSVGRSLGWNLDDGKDLIDLPRYALGKEVTGSAYSDYSATSERDVSREIWSRIINNMPFFLKNKGTVRALKGLINVYGIPSTILRVKEFGGPALSDDASPQFEITRKFTKALDFRGAQNVKVAWANDSTSGRKPDSVEFRFRAATGSNQILVEKQDANNQDFFIRLKDNGSADNYGFVSFMLSGSAVGQTIGQFKEITSSALPVYDGDFYSVMVNRTSGSSNTGVSQSYQLSVGKYDSGRSKIHLYSTSTMDVTQSPSASFSNAWTGSGDIYIGGSGSLADVGAQFSGSIMEYRHWTEILNTGSFKNHIANPKAYDGNSVSSSYENLVLRYSFDDNKSLASDTEGIRDVSSNQTTTLSGSHSGFTGNFFRSVVDEQKTHIPSIGALRRTTSKIRIESNPIKNGEFLHRTIRATNSAYDTAPNDSNKVGIWFAPTDVVNTDIINSVGNLNFEDYLGDPRDKEESGYRGLNYVANNYWKKYTSPNNFWDYIRMIKYYDQSLYPQLRKLIPARAKPDIGLLIEPNIFERPKVVVSKKPDAENRFFSSSIDVGNMVDGLIVITGSYNHGSSITNYDAYTGKINIYSYETGSSVVSSSGEYNTFEASGSEFKDRSFDISIWQKLNKPGIYSNVTMSMGDTILSAQEVQQPIISGSRTYGINKRVIPHYSSSLSESKFLNYSSSLLETDLDNFSHLNQGLRNSYYIGVKNTSKTTTDGNPPVEVIVSAPTRLVTTDGGGSTLDTGDGIVSEFKDGDDKDEKVLNMTFEEKRIKNKRKRKGLRKLKKKVQTDQDRKRMLKVKKLEKQKNEGQLIVENSHTGKPIDKIEFNSVILDEN